MIKKEELKLLQQYAKDLEDWENCLSFNFPDDDDNYGDLEVNLINKEVK